MYLFELTHWCRPNGCGRSRYPGFVQIDDSFQNLTYESFRPVLSKRVLKWIICILYWFDERPPCLLRPFSLSSTGLGQRLESKCTLLLVLVLVHPSSGDKSKKKSKRAIESSLPLALVLVFLVYILHRYKHIQSVCIWHRIINENA